MVAPLVFIKKKVESTILRSFHFFPIIKMGNRTSAYFSVHLIVVYKPFLLS